MLLMFSDLKKKKSLNLSSSIQDKYLLQIKGLSASHKKEEYDKAHPSLEDAVMYCNFQLLKFLVNDLSS